MKIFSTLKPKNVMKRMLMVPTIVAAAILIGSFTVFPSAIAVHSNNTEDDLTCDKWYFLAYKEYQQKGWIPKGIEDKVIECNEDGFKSPWDLPINSDEEESNEPPVVVLSGLKVEFRVLETEIPVSSQIIETKLNPCPSGEIIIDEPSMQILDENAQLSVDVETDRTTLTMISSNPFGEGSLLLSTPCLGMLEK